jgi:hypothetical protein
VNDCRDLLGAAVRLSFHRPRSWKRFRALSGRVTGLGRLPARAARSPGRAENGHEVGQPQPLSLAARHGGQRLAEAQAVETHVAAPVADAARTTLTVRDGRRRSAVNHPVRELSGC